MLCELMLSGVMITLCREVPKFEVFELFNMTESVLSWPRGDIITYGGSVAINIT